MTDIEMARECAKQTCKTAFPGLYEAGKFDDLHEVRSAVAMHAMRQPEIDALKANVEELVECLRKAAEQFRFYEISHRKKGTPDGDAKAITNADFAEKAEALITKHGEPK
jgi:hypothetical protein